MPSSRGPYLFSKSSDLSRGVLSGAGIAFLRNDFDIGKLLGHGVEKTALALFGALASLGVAQQQNAARLSAVGARWRIGVMTAAQKQNNAATATSRMMVPSQFDCPSRLISQSRTGSPRRHEST